MRARACDLAESASHIQSSTLTRSSSSARYVRALTTAALVMVSAVAQAQSVTVNANHTSPQQVGTATTWTATPTNPIPPYAYWFSMTRDGSFVAGSPDYTTNNQWVYTPQQTGTYRVCVDLVGWDGQNYVLEASGCSANYVVVTSVTVTGVTISANKTSPQYVGTAITFTATPTAGTGIAPYSYKWWVSSDNGATYSVLRDWTANGNQYVWTPQQVNSSWRIKAAVRSSGSTSTNGEASTNVAFVTTPTPWVTAVSLAADRTSPQNTGTTITWTATPTYGTAPVYYYWQILRNGSVLSVRDWSTDTHYVWAPQQSGTYRFCVYAIGNGGDPNAPEASTCSADFVINISPTVTAVSLTSNLASPRAVGELIWWTATPSWGTAPISYKWSLSTDNGATWSVLQDWTQNASLFAWRPLEIRNSWRISVAARSAGSTSANGEASATASFVTVASPTVTYVTVTSSPPSPVTVGEPITLTATSIGGTTPLWYYWMISRDGSVIDAVEWTTSNQIVYTPQDTGNWAFSVGVVSTGGNPEEAEAGGGITVAVPPIDPRTPIISSPSNEMNVVGTAITPLQIAATDPQNLQLTYSATGLPAGLSLNQSTGIISGTPTAPAGSYSVKITASNGTFTGKRTVKWTLIQYAHILDNFNANGAGSPLHNRVPTTNWLNSPWVVVEGSPSSPVVNAGAAVVTGVTPSSSGYVVAVIDSGAADGIVGVDFTSTATRKRAGIVLRMEKAETFVALQYTGNETSGHVDLVQRLHNVFTPLKGASVGPLTGTHRLEARMVDGSITALLDGRPLFETTANNNSWGTRHGLLWTTSVDTNATYDNFSVTTDVGPQPLPDDVICEATLNRYIVPVDRGNSTVSVDVTMPNPACWWTAVGDPPGRNGSWVNLVGGPYPMQGNGHAQFRIWNRSDNDPNPRVNFVTVAGHLVMIVQAGANVAECGYSVQPDRAQFNADGGTLTINVAPVYPSCAWAVTPDYRNAASSGWIDISDGAIHFGAGSFSITVPKTPDPLVGRSAYLRIGTFLEWPVEQLPEQCSFALERTAVTVSSNNESFNTLVTAPPDCGWEVIPLQNWLSITENPTGSGNMSFRTSVTNNPTGNPARLAIVELRHGGMARAIMAVLQCPVGAGYNCALDPGGEVSYFHTDALGSVRLITNASGAEVATFDYLPFGQEWAGTSSPNSENVLRFTGKERDKETGTGAWLPLDYSGARYYQSQTGRFATVDPALDVENALVNPQRWNQYTYALNNPLTFSDPDGRSPTLVTAAIGGGIGAFAGFVGSIAVDLSTNKPINWRDAGAAAAGGFVSGALTGLTLGAFAAAGVSVGVGGVMGVSAVSEVGGGVVTRSLDSKASTRPGDMRAAAKDAALGALGGAVGAHVAGSLSEGLPQLMRTEAGMRQAARLGGSGAYGARHGAAGVAAKTAATKTRAEILSTIAGSHATSVVIPVLNASRKKPDDEFEGK